MVKGAAMTCHSDPYRVYGPPRTESASTAEYRERIARATAKGAGWNRHTRAKPVQRERGEQIVLAQFLDTVCAPLVRALGLDPELCAGWCHVANERTAREQRHASLANQGVKRGIPDCIVWVVPAGSPFHGVSIELKEPNASFSAVSDEQRAWIELHKAVGWRAIIAFGADAAISWLKGLGYGRPT
jgi:hypothetical protein